MIHTCCSMPSSANRSDERSDTRGLGSRMSLTLSPCELRGTSRLRGPRIEMGTPSHVKEAPMLQPWELARLRAVMSGATGWKTVSSWFGY